MWSKYIKHQEQKGELISDFYRTNITKKAISERWGLDILVKQQEKAKIAKAERERKKAEEQAEQLKKENEQKEIEKQRNFVIKKFEMLSSEQQEMVIQTIFEQVGQGAFKQIFQTAQKQGTVHTDARFVKKFYEYFKQEECAKTLRRHPPVRRHGQSQKQTLSGVQSRRRIPQGQTGQNPGTPLPADKQRRYTPSRCRIPPAGCRPRCFGTGCPKIKKRATSPAPFCCTQCNVVTDFPSPFIHPHPT